MKVNLACGEVYVCHSDWLNLDYVSTSAAVQRANLLGSLPLEDCSADLVYCSHFIEHIPSDHVSAFLQECRRILRPGGVLRLVVPDLENLCRTYLHYRDQGHHTKADFVVMEILDQCVRNKSGGELWRYYQSLSNNPQINASNIAFVRERTGEDLMNSAASRRRSLRKSLRRIPSFAERLWIKTVIQFLPRAFRHQNVSLTSVGERHHWLYDTHSIKQHLSDIGFESIDRCTASTSCYPDFPFLALDLSADGHPRKGLESLFIEAKKPG
ncbi:class I SAM-dependent methyltransferase [Synechococcus sp. CBW1107]|uniref:class I SAM-dependent methyltransferase n=1 Tax=Synechococcus sp. CBW1107 TaxID=2789857 RepID=UPI002AD4BB82|nr:methyltransferase domain-containing protein [Synechococcus sp. CBW1107]CAK6687488.1 hypothetical protein MNNICLKF_00227 [Synechococcus sp. CBW1107]